ncbi:glycerate kinase type-2 family protein [Parasulfitobacter algicola]|uniref:DUF4147 domain-containing protein n=1 Tax=Parasulfitobacter algicola TaxID=2614809 RepID=A0ABX2INB3_9RHOB|nr:DUF4147 domain-containing protein [Sulfitobacter algicola]NSX54376.1 DUF4147 domain-containing protein [Sulfitobacter algicola]
MSPELSQMRHIALTVFQAGVDRADPFRAVQVALHSHPAAEHHLQIIAVGKAAMRMTQAALSRIPAPLGVIVVTNYENAGELSGARVFAAGHPVPDENGVMAADAVCDALQKAQGNILALISGGGSALLPAPVPGITLADKQAVNSSLLSSGADIETMNLVRQNISRLKGGGFLRLAAPAQVRALILSDVVSDDLRAIASGPTASPLGNRMQARAALEELEIWGDMPPSVRDHLSQPDDMQPNLIAENDIIGSNQISLDAMAAQVPDARVLATPLTGDVRDAAAQIIQFANGPGAYLFGGETTVRITGQGKGGRNQELALRVAMLAEQAGWDNWVYLQGGTDGRDGPTDAAGGVVDAGTLDRARTNGIDPNAILVKNDSYHLLSATGDLLITGATGTNVADLGVLIRW